MSWLTTQQAADIADCHPNTMRIKLNSGEIHGHQMGAKARWRVSPDAVDAWIRSDGADDGAEACGCREMRIARPAS
jgi:excisionase family DNA binding protein